MRSEPELIFHAISSLVYVVNLELAPFDLFILVEPRKGRLQLHIFYFVRGVLQDLALNHIIYDLS